ncbi:hypothetical protein [Jannaschia sp. W003]|uniref:hypothetical protein n=1 Tax=Jannaschia sp. W003 TaxID=2867012 RepID=UPI0021A756EA|nr:hypothetical protein [Jannaschia sp. W003]UWQ23091.1 hypothetical protein K3554_16120 [Jannaschia sp. W003]
MTRRFLTETPANQTRPLTVGRAPVHDSWDQLQTLLGSALGPKHAALFAQPYAGTDGVGWMADTAAEPRPLSALPPEARAAALERAEALTADVAALAQRYASGKSAEDRRWGMMLDTIQQQPAGVPLEDRLWVAGDQPVLVQWGARDESTVSTGALLRETRAAPDPGITRIARGAAGAAPVLASGPVAASPWPWAWLLWLLFAAILAAILLVLVAACALNLPPSWQVFAYCPPEGRAEVVRAEGDALRREVDRLTLVALGAPRCDVDDPPRWAADRPATAAPPPPAPVPTPTDQPDPGPTEIDRAREDAGGAQGDVTVTLLWNGRSDLDLTVVCPSGQTMIGGASRCGGTIDIDQNRCSGRVSGNGSVCRTYFGTVSDNPIENGYFDADGGQEGTYSVRVRHYAASEVAPRTPVPWVVQLRDAAGARRFEGVVAPGETDDVTTFRLK